MGQWLSAVATGSILLNLAALGKLYLQSRRDGWAIHERGWQRATELEQEAKLLRIALHRQRVTSSVRLTISEILVLAMPLPLEARIEAVKQARQIAESSLKQGDAS